MIVKRIIALFIMLCSIILTGCSSNAATLPEKHLLSYPEGMETTEDYDGADAYGGVLDEQNTTYFTVNDYYNMKSNGTLHILPNFETYQQTTEYTCGCASILMALNYYGIDDYNEMEIADKAGTVEHIGTSPEGLCSFLDEVGVKYDSHIGTDTYFEDEMAAEAYIIERIDAGEPILVDWEDWGGHWDVIIGIDTCDSDSPDDDVLIFADPYDISDHYQDGYYTYPFGRFFTMWREGACAKKENPYYQPFISPDKP